MFKPAKIEYIKGAYCGATVLMLLSGESLETVRGIVNRKRNKRGALVKARGKNVLRKRKNTMQVKGMYHEELSHALKRLGYSHEEKRVWDKKPSLRTFADDFQYVKKPIIVCVGRHYVLLWAGSVYDTFSPQGKSVTEHDYALSRVSYYWIIQNADEAQERGASSEINSATGE